MVFWRWVILSALSLILAACSSVSLHGMQGAQIVPSPNYDYRRPVLVVLHHTGASNADSALKTLTTPALKVSSHYLITKSGKIIQLVDEHKRAWHAGVSKWRGFSDINSISIGVELDNNGSEPYAQAQIQALLTLLQDLKSRYRLSTTDFVGHADVAPGRKVDPSFLFPWHELAAKGFGVWCSPPWAKAPEDFNLPNALSEIGYDISRLDAARHSFALHYAQGGPLDQQQEKDLAYCLLKKIGTS